jgi:hypothetical protein
MSYGKEIQMIMDLTGVDEAKASAAHARFGNMEDAIDSLLEKPTVSGDKYLPAKRKLENGLTPEQEERCKRGRWLQDQVNVVFSVAHSKIRTLQDPVVEESTEQTKEIVLPSLEVLQSQQGVPEKTTLPSLQSESPP